MSASPAVAAAFQDWKLAEVAVHYSCPCPDEIMDQLTDRAGVLYEHLQALTPANADDVVLQLYPILVREFEPKRGEPPLLLSTSSTHNYEPVFITRLCRQIAAVCPAIADAMSVPHQSMPAGECK
ncbi:hypothetical protein [Sphingomonas sp. BK235]|uniref:hypothetical protein n=1 Tax=Sphingomonas sp. BK235 TaxID=2512131 RepID=UPI001053B8B1|nr:hypothetical protein [Sphingomonas sp. BK235]TCP36530.1 hypothetical protein EV292_10126 [Sphingomonas sp. BK235]